MAARIRQHPMVQRADALAQRFLTMVRRRHPEALDGWLADCLASQIPELQSFAQGIHHEYASIRAALESPWSTGPVEGQISRLKYIKRSMYGRASLALLKQRVVACG